MVRIPVDMAAVAEICRRHQISEMALFGSVTRADFTPESDVDVLVEFVPGARVTLFEMVDIRDELTTLFGREIDLATPRMLSQYFRDDVLANRHIIYTHPAESAGQD